MPTETFKFYYDNLTEECQARFAHFLGGDNGNYDFIPLAEMEVEVTQELVNQRCTSKILKDAMNAVAVEDFHESWMQAANNQLKMIQDKYDQLNSWKAYSIWDIGFYGVFSGLVALAVSLLVSYSDPTAQIASFISGTILGAIINFVTIQRPKIKKWRADVNALHKKVTALVEAKREMHAQYREDPDVVACRKVFEDHDLPFTNVELCKVLELVSLGYDTLEKAAARRNMDRNTIYTETTEDTEDGTNR